MRRRPVPGPDEDVNIYDLAGMDDASVRVRVEQTLESYPALRRLYDVSFLDLLVPDRQNFDNHLLLLLADNRDDFANGFWIEVIADLTVLEDVGGFESFRPKFRKTGRTVVQSAKTELELAAWMRRKGHPVVLEPLNAETGRKCEFDAESVPPTSWEVKSVLDQAQVREAEKIRNEVAKHLRYIPEPYQLKLNAVNLNLRDVHEAVHSILQQIRAFHRAGGEPVPVTFESHGLSVTIIGRSPRTYGYTGVESLGAYWLGNEDIRRVLSRLRDAVSQLPQGRAGIAVIDTTMANFLDDVEVEGACYGELIGAVIEGQFLHVRTQERLFRPDMNTRMSVVIHYERKGPGGVAMNAYHNPFAEQPLPPEVLRDSRVKQFRLVWVTPRTKILEEFH